MRASTHAPIALLVAAAAACAAPPPPSTDSVPVHSVSVTVPASAPCPAPKCLSFAECHAACTACGGGACERLARFHEARREDDRAAALMERACSDHVLQACYELVLAQSDFMPDVLDRSVPANARLLEEAERQCTSDDGRACFILARHTLDGDLMDRACEMGSSDACRTRMLPPFFGLPHKRPGRSYWEVLEVDCDNGDPGACWSFGGVLLSMEFENAGGNRSDWRSLIEAQSDPRYQRAKALLQRALDAWDKECSAGWILACVPDFS